MQQTVWGKGLVATERGEKATSEQEGRVSSVLGLGWGTPQFFMLSVAAKLPQSCLTLFNPMNCSPPDSSVRGILQARIPEWVAISSSRGSSRWNTGMEPVSVTCPALAGGFFTIAPPGKPSLCWYRLQGYPF